MPLTAELSRVVRETIAECLGIDVGRVVAEANFFVDLGGTGEHLKPMRLAIENALGGAIEPIVAEVNARTAIGSDGNMTPESLRQIREYLGDWPGVPEQPGTFPAMFSVGMIEAITAKAIESGKQPIAHRHLTLSPDYSEVVRRELGGLLGISATRMTGTKTLLRNPVSDEPALVLALAVVGIKLDLEVLGVFQQVLSSVRDLAGGNPTEMSMTALRVFLPKLDPNKPNTFDTTKIITVDVIEQCVAQAIAQKESPEAAESGKPGPLKPLPLATPTPKVGPDSTWQISDALGPRRSRLLLAGALRHVFTCDSKLDWEIAEVLEVLEEFADTGKNTAAMKKAFREVSKWKTWKHIELAALELALSDTPKDAIPKIHKALRKMDNPVPLDHLQSDLVSPLTDPQAFSPAWRTPAVAQLAQKMYDARDFTDMPRLADELERAGCQHPTVLGHCRDPKAIHLRGCWVIDAVLDGSWNKSAKAKKSAKESEKKSLLSTLPRREQLWIKEAMEGPNGKASFEELAAQNWDFEKYCQWHRMPEKNIQEMLSYWHNAYAGLTEEQIQTIFGIHRVADLASSGMPGVGNSLGLAKRIVFEDPSYLSRGVCLDWRLSWFSSRQYGGEVEALASRPPLAVRDWRFVRRMFAENPKRPAMQWDENYFHYLATLAILEHDDDALANIVAKMKARDADPTTLAMDLCFEGISERSASMVASGLQRMLDIQRAAKNKEGFGVCYLEAHGLFRLAEHAAPELIAEFDVTQAFPWDREFHEWTCRHEHPLQGLDLTSISPILHQIIVDLDLPDWFRPSPTLLDQNPLCDMVLTSVGTDPKKVVTLIRNTGLSNDTKEKVSKRIEHLPVTIQSRCGKVSGEHYQKQFEAIGATVELMD